MVNKEAVCDGDLKIIVALWFPASLIDFNISFAVETFTEETLIVNPLGPFMFL